MRAQNQPDALQLSDELDVSHGGHSNEGPSTFSEAAQVLRRLQSENEALRAGYDAARLEIESLQARIAERDAQEYAIGAGGMEPLRKRCLHQISEPAQPVAHVSQETFNDDGTSDIIKRAAAQEDALRCAVGNCKFNGEVDKHSPNCANTAAPAQAAPVDATKLPSPANVGTAPKCLNLNDQAMWALGWNECLEAARAAQGDK